MGRRPTALKHRFETDSPLTRSQEDAYDRAPFAAGIVRAIEHLPSDQGFVIGIHGPWGDGKTTVLNFLREDFEAAGIQHLLYNPWRFSDEGRMLASLFTELARAIGVSRPKLLGLVAQYVSAVADVGSLLDERVNKAVKTVTSAVKQSLEQRRDELQRRMREAKVRLVVLIDDIDRLDKHELHTLFRIIKACADLPGVVYILAFDDQAVADALQDRYGNSDPRAGRKFLEKIIQMPLALPPADPAALERQVRLGLESLFAELQLSLTDPERRRFDDLFTLGIRRAIKTPRQVKRYLNACRFALSALKNEASPADVILVEGLRCMYPESYAVVRTYQEWFCGIGAHQPPIPKAGQTLSLLLQPTLKDLSAVDALAVNRLLEGLFPRFGPEKDNLRLTPISVIVWEERRVCAPSYCARYFCYAVPKADVSNQVIEQLFKVVEREDSRMLPSLLAEVLSPVRQVTGIERLIRGLPGISARAADRLARAISVRSDDFQEPFSLHQSGVGARAAELIRFLIVRTEDPDAQCKLVESIIASTPAAWFAAAVWMQLDPIPGPDRQYIKLVPWAVIQSANKAIAQRSALERRSGMKFLELERRWRFEFLQIWGKAAGPEVTGALFLPSMQGDRNICIELLKCACQPVARSGETIPQPGDLEPRHVQDLRTIIDIQEMAKIMERTSMDGIRHDPPNWLSLPQDVRRLAQFLHYVKTTPFDGESTDQASSEAAEDAPPSS